MPGPWKAWKSKSSFSPLPTAPWKSRQKREIPTFPQPGIAPDGKVENQNQVSHFSTRSVATMTAVYLSSEPKTKKGDRPLRSLLNIVFQDHAVLETKLDFRIILRLENADVGWRVCFPGGKTGDRQRISGKSTGNPCQSPVCDEMRGQTGDRQRISGKSTGNPCQSPVCDEMRGQTGDRQRISGKSTGNPCQSPVCGGMRGQTGDRQRISGKCGRKFMSVPSLLERVGRTKPIAGKVVWGEGVREGGAAGSGGSGLGRFGRRLRPGVV